MFDFLFMDNEEQKKGLLRSPFFYGRVSLISKNVTEAYLHLPTRYQS